MDDAGPCAVEGELLKDGRGLATDAKDVLNLFALSFGSSIICPSISILILEFFELREGVVVCLFIMSQAGLEQFFVSFRVRVIS